MIRIEKHDGVATIVVDNPPVNALSPGVPEGIRQRLEEALEDDAVEAIVLIGAGSAFIAGADIRELERAAQGGQRAGEGLFPLITALEASPKPVVAALHGNALGGGLEIAQACHYRVALAAAKLGQPEVKIGIIPGAGGTQRMPRLAGFARALELCAIGDPIGAEEALGCGLVDRVTDGVDFDALLAGAVAFAAERAASAEPHPVTSRLAVKHGTAEEDAAASRSVRETLGRKRRGFEAPLRAAEAVEAALALPFEDGMRREAELFQTCLRSAQARALMHAFFAERRARKIPGLSKETRVKTIERAAVVGGGTMGSGITIAYLSAGIPVLLKETSQEQIDRAVAMIRASFDLQVKRGRLDSGKATRLIAALTPTLSYDGFGEVDIVVEAVFEDMALKQRVFAELDAVVSPEAILATNTSTLDVDAIASAASRPERSLGHHFFSPAERMRLLEVVRGSATSDETLATSLALGKRLRKVAVVAGNAYGFIGNRMFAPYRRESQFLVEEGASIEQVDAALVDFGMAMGPLAVGDLAGLDVGQRIRQQHPNLYPPGLRKPLADDALCEAGRYGRKTGRGWYVYEQGQAPRPDPEAEAIVLRVAADAGIEQRPISADEIVDRTVLALVNEGARLLDEGIALRASDIDVVYLNGYGFPAWRGGPMQWADELGLARVVERISALAPREPVHWKLAGLLGRLVNQGKTLTEFDRERDS